MVHKTQSFLAGTADRMRDPAWWSGCAVRSRPVAASAQRMSVWLTFTTPFAVAPAGAVKARALTPLPAGATVTGASRQPGSARSGRVRKIDAGPLDILTHNRQLF